MNEEIIAQYVSELILRTYALPYKNLAKHLTDKQIKQFINARPNSDEFSVLSGIVYWHGEDLSSMRLVCLTTGVKCVPDIKLKSSHGKLVHDMHAEVLSLRSFSWYIMEEIKKLGKVEGSDLVESDNAGKYRLKSDIRLALYISEVPCGDCSLDELAQLDPMPWADVPQSSYALRGRASYTQVGIVRTKPGRRDSPISLSKSCGDKLATVSMKGLLKGIVADLITNKHVLLDYIVLPADKVQKNIASLNRCFNQRIDFTAVEFYHRFKILEYPEEIIAKYSNLLKENRSGTLEIDREKKRRACDLSLVCIPESNVIEVINGGVKNGNSVKTVLKSGRGSSMLCRYSMFQKRIQLENSCCTYKSYLDWKKRASNAEYTDKVKRAKKSLGTWGDSTVDDFTL
ncbi:hypothetical protein PMKS-003736 [Pichia membranifaciens]|uniref:A to I editase domain-containing protein n=1 Tax=Pichia membranifaciens TaxID=4926 RepID=A0A1Q2YKZ6_9ASCO|nr:hypothetical protein PMKS-003736 [Pichia membranifaciens]